MGSIFEGILIVVKEFRSSSNSKMNTTTQSVCMILDDEELERQGKFREWREDKQVLSAKRIFGSPGTGPKAFPKAFQNYKPGSFRSSAIPKNDVTYALANSVRQMLSIKVQPDVSGSLVDNDPLFIPRTPPICEDDESRGALQNERGQE